MLHVVTTLERYFLLDVVEPNWRLLEKRVREAATVEQILSFHNDCINSSLRQCLLTDIKLFKVALRHHSPSSSDAPRTHETCF